MSQLPDVRVSPPPASILATASAASTSALMTFDDYEADFELQWLGYILAKSQPPNPNLSQNLRVPQTSNVPKASYQRLAVSNDDLQNEFEQKPSGYIRSRSDTCLADEDRCEAESKKK